MSHFTFISSTPFINRTNTFTQLTQSRPRLILTPRRHPFIWSASASASSPSEPNPNTQSSSPISPSPPLDSSANPSENGTTENGNENGVEGNGSDGHSSHSAERVTSSISSKNGHAETGEVTGNENGVDNNGHTDGEVLSVEPVKNISELRDSSGALQIDDGSLAPVATPLVPRRLVRRGRGREERTSFQEKLLRATRIKSVRSDLSAGFDSGFLSTAVLLSLFGIWYWSNAAFNVLNKQALHAFPFPLTITCVQFAVASVVMASTWLLRLKKAPTPSPFVLKTCLPLGVLHAAGFVLTNMSLGKVSVAFTHTVKATEPFFSVALTPSILGDVPTWGIIGSLFPIVAGVAIASATDVSFNWPGFLSAIGSNLMIQWRNILSKRLMNTSSSTTNQGKKSSILSLTRSQIEQLDSLDNVNLFTSMTILAFVILIPITIFMEGFPLVTTLSASSVALEGMSRMKLVRLLVVGGVYRCLDVLSSYMILKRVSPVSHSIGNCVKRAVVIIASIIFFKTQVTSLNIIGTTLALIGVFIYSIIVSACKQNSFGPDSPFCRPIYNEEVELTEGGGI